MGSRPSLGESTLSCQRQPRDLSITRSSVDTPDLSEALGRFALMFEERAADSSAIPDSGSETYAERFCAGLSEPVPRPRMPESYAQDFCAGLSDPQPEWGASVGDTSVPVSPEIEALEKAVAAVAAVDPSRLGPAQALADASALVALMQSLKVATLTRVADVEERKLHRIDGAPT